jgi:hypothetical protein
MMGKYRTIAEAAKEIRELDPRTCITENYIRELCRNNIIPLKKAGKKYILNLDGLMAYLEEE